MRAAIAGAIAAALITLPGLGAGTLWDNSETAYGEVAREILLTHDWIVMHFNTVPYFVQPPLYFWFAAIAATILGPTALAMRLPSALATIALAGMTGYGVARQAGTRVGTYAAAVLSSCLIVALIGRLAIMDALLDLAVALAIFWWFRGMQTGRDRYFVYGWLAAGFGFLAKGLVAPAVALMVAVPYFFWNRRAEPTYAPSPRAWLWGLLAFAIVVVPWPLALVAQFKLFPLMKLFGEYTFGRYTGVVENQAGPIYYYVPVLLLGLFPWTAFAPMAIANGIAELRAVPQRPEIARLVRLAFAWAVVPFAFFSLAGTKLPNYIALEFPALALLAALYFDAVARKGGTRSAVVSAAFVPATIALLAAAIAVFIRTNKLGSAVEPALPGLAGLGAAIFIGSTIAAIAIGRRSSAAWAPYALVAATLVAMDVIAIAVLPQTEAFKPIPRLAAIVDRRREPFDKVAIQSISGGNALLFYTRPDVIVLAPFEGGDARVDAVDPRVEICGAPRVWVVAPRARPAYDPTFGRRRTLVAQDVKAALYLYDGPLCRL